MTPASQPPLWRTDVTPQAQEDLEELLTATREVMLSGRYAIARRVAQFEQALAQWLGVAAVVGVQDWMDGLVMAMRAIGIAPGQGAEVITTPFTALPTLAAIVHVGARPVLVDMDPDTWQMDLAQVVAAITPNTRAVLPVHVFFQMTDIPALRWLLPPGVAVIEDVAQGMGCQHHGHKAGAQGDFAAFSFYPSKPLGGFSDSGALALRDPAQAEAIRAMRCYRMHPPAIAALGAVNSRMSELEAAWLLIKLARFDARLEQTRALGARYDENLAGLDLVLPRVDTGMTPNYHLYPVRLETTQRDRLKAHLQQQGIQTDVFYDPPHHLHPGYRFLGHRPGDFPQAEKAGREMLALPIYPEMTLAQQDRVVAAIQSFFGGNGD